MDFKQEFLRWETALKDTPYGGQLEEIKQNPEEMEDRFYKHLEFGTAGMRGVIGMGTNRMNIFTVRRCSQGLGDYLLSIGAQEKGVAIAYDSRLHSDEFAKEAALTLCGMGIRVYLYDTLKSVPQLSFAIMQLGCAAGVVITASHNPKIYNGYKVYGSGGGQLASESAEIVTKFIEKIDDMFAIRPMDENAAIEKGLLTYIGAEIDELYYKRVEELCINPEDIKKQADSLNVVYTPLFGTGNIPVRRVLKDLGLKHVAVVESQEKPNGEFPGLKAPNPEEKDAFLDATTLANKVGANMIIATDPDCDRMGVCVKDQNGEFVTLAGNQIGCLLLDFILANTKREEGEFAVKSIVSTQMADAIARHYGIEMRDVLTGFKYIAEQINLSLTERKGKFVFGFEESYGFLRGTFVRDKDAVIASMLTVSAACYYANRGMTLFDAVQELYKKYGYFEEKVISKTLMGISGIEKIQNAVVTMRNNPPKTIGKWKVEAVSDYKLRERIVVSSGKKEKITLPVSDVLSYEFNGGRLILRPSGTEPKLKAYLSVCVGSKSEAEAEMKTLTNEIERLLEKLIA